MAQPDKPVMPTFPMDVIAIQKCIPHRHPFLFIDRVLEAVPNERIVATKNVSIADPLLQGHFPGQPVLPGVVIVETIAQATAVLGYLSHDLKLEQCLLTEVQSARFRRQVVPGDVLRIEATLVKRRAPFFWFDAVCSVDGEPAAEVKLSALMK